MSSRNQLDLPIQDLLEPAGDDPQLPLRIQPCYILFDARNDPGVCGTISIEQVLLYCLPLRSLVLLQ